MTSKAIVFERNFRRFMEIQIIKARADVLVHETGVEPLRALTAVARARGHVDFLSLMREPE